MTAIRKDILYTVSAQAFVALALFAQYRIVSDTWGVDALANYTFLFRVRGAIEWIVVMLIPLALTRQLSSETVPQKRTEFLAVGIATTFLLVAAASLILLAFPAFFSKLLFGRDEFANWMVPFGSLLTAYCLNLLATGVLRGMFAFRESSVVSVSAIAIVPAVCLLLGRGHAITSVMTVMGIASSIASLVGLIAGLALRGKGNFAIPMKLPLTRLASRLGELFSFGAPRLVTLTMNALFAVALPWLLAREQDSGLLANFNIMMAFITAGALITSPVGFVLLPHFSRSLASGERGVAADRLRKVSAATVFIGVTGSVIAAGFMQDALSIMFGRSYAEYVALQFAVAICVPCFLIIDVFRSVLDAASRLPLNSLVYGAGLVATICVFVVPLPVPVSLITRASVALAVGYLAAAAACIACASRSFATVILGRSEIGLLISWLCASVSWFVLAVFLDYPPVMNRVFGLVLAAGFVLYLFRSRPAWLEAAGLPSAKP
jgi:O-antigen/teichoic acid export membrane protein